MNVGNLLDPAKQVHQSAGASQWAHFEGTFTGEEGTGALSQGQAERILRVLAGDGVDRPAAPLAAPVGRDRGPLIDASDSSARQG